MSNPDICTNSANAHIPRIKGASITVGDILTLITCPLQERFIKQRKMPSMNQFKTGAVIRNQTSDNSPKIQQAIENALIEIEESLSSQ